MRVADVQAVPMSCAAVPGCQAQNFVLGLSVPLGGL